MNSVTSIRPHTQPTPLPDLFKDLEVLDFYDENGTRAQLKDASEYAISGITVTNNDCDKDWIFVAIPGLTRHGIRFAPDAIEAGATVIVTDPSGYEASQNLELNVPIVVVSDPRALTAVLASRIYSHPAKDLTTLAVTGTNGKTTTSYLMRAALGVAYPHATLCGTVETWIGDLRFPSDYTTAENPIVQRFLALTREKNCEAAVIETSSHALSLNRVDTIEFDAVAFTNLQHDHLDFYGDWEHYYEAKKMLFSPERAKRGVVCVDDEWGQRLAKDVTIPVVTVSALSDTPADWMVENIHPDTNIGRTVFTLIDPEGHKFRVEMPILGEVNVQNTAVAIVTVVSLGYDTQHVIDAVETAEQIPARMQKINPTPRSQPLVIVDYAHTPEALEWTLRSTKQLTRGKLHIVFGSDGDRDPTKRDQLGAIAARECDVLWVTDENPRWEDPQSIRDQVLVGVRQVRPDLHDVHEIRTCRRDAVRKAILHATEGDTVIITGKGAEWYQDFEGIRHRYNDVPVAQEVLEYARRI